MSDNITTKISKGCIYVMLRFVINKELDVTRRELVNYLIGYASQHNVTLSPYEEKPFALSAYATETVLLPSCANVAKQIHAADNTCESSTNAACASNKVSNENNNTTVAPHNAISNIAAGRIYCIRKWDEVEVDLLACNPDYRIHGAGTALMSHAEHITQQNNCHHMTLMILEFQARPFYERLGFRLIAEQKEFAGKYKAYHLTKTLSIPQSKCVSLSNNNHNNEKKKELYRNIRVQEDDNLDAAQDELVEWLHFFDEKNGAYDVPPFDRIKYAIYAVAHDSRACVGGALFETWWSNMTVEMFVINPLEQHKGYGTQLVQELTRFAYAQRCKRITVYATDVTAKNLLSLHGFVQTGEQHDIPHPLQRYWMEKMLEYREHSFTIINYFLERNIILRNHL